MRALESIQLQPKTQTIPHATVASNSETSPDWRQNLVPLPPTPPQLEGEESCHWSGDSHISPTTTADGAERYEGVIDKGSNGATTDENERNEEAMASEADLIEFEEGVRTQEGESLCPKRVYTQEELAILTQEIFGDEEEEDDAAFWDDADGASRYSREHKLSCASVMSQQDGDNDTGGDKGESGGKEASKLDGLFGPTSNTRPSTRPR